MIGTRIAPVVVAALTVVTPVLSQRPVPLVLDQIEVVLDSATYHDVVTSPFLREQFAAVDTVDNQMLAGLPGVRLFGRYNYLTFANPARNPAGDVVLVLGVEAPGGLETVANDAHLKLRYGARGVTDAGRMEPEYLRGDRKFAVPTGADSTSSHAGFEIMQYGASAASLLARIDSLPASNLTNARFLAPYFDSRKLLAYVISATLAIPVDDIHRIVTVLSRDHVKVTSEGEGAVIDLGGITLHLVPPWSGAGVKQLTFALTTDVPANPVYRFGPKSQLRFGPGPVAVWDFAPR